MRFVAVLACGFCLQARADDRPDAVPYRPTVSTPATLTAPGWLELEVGGIEAVDRHPDADPIRRAALPYTLKLAFTDDWGIRVGGEALVRRSAAGGERDSGAGDTTMVLKRRFAIDDASAFGLEAGVDLPTGRAGLHSGSGRTDWSINGIYSTDLGAWHTDANLVETRFGAAPSVGRWQRLAAWSWSRALADRWTIAGEVSGARQDRVATTAQALAAVSYAARRDLVFDAGVAHALNRATPTWQVFAGVTAVLGRAY